MKKTAILDTGINCDFRSLRLCVPDLNAKAQRREGDYLCRHVLHVVVIQPTIKKLNLWWCEVYHRGERRGRRVLGPIRASANSRVLCGKIYGYGDFTGFSDCAR